MLAPGLFFISAVALIVLRGPVTQASFDKLTPMLGETVAAWLPRLAIISICLMSWWWTLYYGDTTRGTTEDAVAAQAAQSPAAEKGDATQRQPGGDK